MKKVLFYSLFAVFSFMSCMGEFPGNDGTNKQQIDENVKKVFGTTFDKNQDWCTTTSGVITLNSIPSGTQKVQLLALVAESDTTTSMTILNEIANPANHVEISYDAPSNNLGLYVAYVTDGGYSIKKVGNTTGAFARTRGTGDEYSVPDATPVIGNIEDSWAAQRGWIEGEKLYQLSDYTNVGMPIANYTEEDIASFRALIFSYFKNGRDYNNLPLVTGGGYYNANAYPVTTGSKPIVLSPVYKSDKAKQYGNEVWNSDLYYYYFKDSDIEGKTDEEQVAFFESLPKYKAIEFKYHFGETEDDVLEKRSSYALMYFGDGIPELGTEGSYQFPEGYKIGFMVRAKTEFKENGKPRKQGELYGDGRLNVNINGYSECNFKGSFKDKNLPLNSPRVAWLVINGRVMMCWESGTDRDFNDIIIEVEGGIEPISIIPELDNNYYTFCFEDRELGDYDMNDVVIKGRRLNETKVEYSIVACGAQDKLEVRNIGSLSGVEIHSLFGYDGFINTTKDGQYFEPQTVVINVDKKFSFLNTLTQPFLYDKSTNKYIYLSKVGEDPHGIMIPNDFKYPLERICIKDAYERFNSWGQNSVTSNDWYKHPVEDKVFIQ